MDAIDRLLDVRAEMSWLFVLLAELCIFFLYTEVSVEAVLLCDQLKATTYQHHKNSQKNCHVTILWKCIQ